MQAPTPPRALPGSPLVGHLLARGLASYGERICAVENDVRLSYRALSLRAARLGNGLCRLGLQNGDRVALLADNSLLCLEAYLGVPSAGLVLAPLNSRLALAEIQAILADAGCAALVAGPGFEESAAAATSGLGTRVIGTQPAFGALAVEALIESGSETFALDASSEDTAYLYYTSGTTGRPKGVMLSHRNVLAGALSAVAAAGLTSAHTWLHAGPMFHLADAFAIWGMSWIGARHVCMRFKPEEAARVIDRERITHTLLVPTAVSMLADAAAGLGTRLAPLEGLLYGGAPMPGAIFARARERFDAALVATYGMTEASGILTCADTHDVACSHDVPVSQGEAGELVVSSPAVMKGYRGLEALSAEILAGGRLRTGDIGRREPDGTVTLVDRKKDMIISGGENVYPREVELALERHPAVAEVAVVGAPDPQWGEAVCAVVRIAAGAQLTLEELRAHARASLAAYKLPRRLVVVDELPRTSSGKVSKGELRKRVAANP
jgi:long-chain acyl-CoA synthetase